MNTNSKGKLWEMAAVKYLKKKRYKLIEANYTTRFGEIDLIMKYKKFICFIEVKQRDVNSFASPAEYVTPAKQKKIITAAQIYLANNETDLQPRFDVIEIYTSDNEINSIKHLENAFDLL
ncbi:MAG: YraN family protein [Clostridiales bacterium]|nr:YraN family protein [Clostridiales bacterium]